MTEPLIEVNYEQRSPEWFEWRKGVRTASVAPIIMGQPPNWGPQTWDDLRLELAGYGEDVSDFVERARNYGARVEDRVRMMFFKGGEPACFQRGVYAASLDGWKPKKRRFAEIKCPMVKMKSRLLRHAIESLANGLPPKECILPYVWWQMVHQAGVMLDAADEGWMIVYGVQETRTVKVPTADLLADWPALQERWESFAAGDQKWIGGSDRDEFTRLAKILRPKYQRMKKLEAEVKQLKARLQELGVGEAAGVKVVEESPLPRVNWQKGAAALYAQIADPEKDPTLKEWADDFRPPRKKRLTVRIAP